MLASCQSMVEENVISSLPSETKTGEIILEAPAGQRERVYVVEGNICSVLKRGMSDYVFVGGLLCVGFKNSCRGFCAEEIRCR